MKRIFCSHRPWRFMLKSRKPSQVTPRRTQKRPAWHPCELFNPQSDRRWRGDKSYPSTEEHCCLLQIWFLGSQVSLPNRPLTSVSVLYRYTISVCVYLYICVCVCVWYLGEWDYWVVRCCCSEGGYTGVSQWSEQRGRNPRRKARIGDRWHPEAARHAFFEAQETRHPLQPRNRFDLLWFITQSCSFISTFFNGLVYISCFQNQIVDLKVMTWAWVFS